MSNLVWSPVHRVLEDTIAGGDDIILILAPFVKLEALKRLNWVHTGRTRINVVARWKLEDLIAGVSDVEVYTYLKDLGAQLYINTDIHLKLYVFASNNAFNTSGNVTLRGLGYSDAANIEVGNIIPLEREDWTRIYGIIAQSRRVDDALYERLKNFLAQQVPRTEQVYPDDLFPPMKRYTISSLPATISPIRLAEFYFPDGKANFSPDETRRALHDLSTFAVPSNLMRQEFERYLCHAFCATPFVSDFIEYIRRESALRFGAVNLWIHQKCEDVPLPYRWEIKENTRILYDWLAHFVPEISWDRPNHSQIIRWSTLPPGGNQVACGL